MSVLPRSVLLVGAGKMGGALLGGLLDRGLAPASVTVVDPNPAASLVAAAGDRGFAVVPAVPADAAPEVVLLAVKPQMLEAVAPALARPSFADALLVSIMAGKTVGNLTARLPFRAVVRAMPNTPAAIGRGATGLYANAATGPDQRAVAAAIFGGVGILEWVEDEALIDAVTAVSGSGPAYAFLLVECLAEAGRGVGLPPDQAARLARATVIGAAELLAREAGTGPDELRRNVTSPGGTTAAALAVLQAEDGLPALLERAVRAARDRAVALAG